MGGRENSMHLRVLFYEISFTLSFSTLLSIFFAAIGVADLQLALQIAGFTELMSLLFGIMTYLYDGS